jgi:hypothetical protein
MTHPTSRKLRPGILTRGGLNGHLPLGTVAMLALAAAVPSAAARTQLPAAPAMPAAAAIPTTPVAPPPVVVSGTHGIAAHSSHAVVQAIEAARNSFQANTAQSNDQAAYDQFAQSFLSKAHYYGSETAVSGELRSGAYSGTHTVTVTVPVSQLIDPTTKAVYAQPVALVGCWITINERPALRARGNELATKDNFNHVSMNYAQYFMDGTLIKSTSP